jgi:hypothetical protein
VVIRIEWSPLKLRLRKVHGPGPLRLTKRRGKTFVTVKEIIPVDRSKATP